MRKPSTSLLKKCERSSTPSSSSSSLLRKRRVGRCLPFSVLCMFGVFSILKRQIVGLTSSLLLTPPQPEPPSINDIGSSKLLPQEGDTTRGATTKTAGTAVSASTEEVVVEEEPVYYYYSIARPDRSGMVFSSMLLAHAYVFSKNSTNKGGGEGGIHYYAGACPTRHPDYPAYRMPPRRLQSAKHLIQDLGLQNILNFACPSNATVNEEKKHTVVWVSGNGLDATFDAGPQYETPEWLAHVRSQVEWEKVKTGEEDGDGIFRIAVHVRRGDATPCSKRTRTRYLPNAHYLRVLDEFTPNDRPTRVYIFSETRSSESWAPFRARNYTMMLDVPINTTWAYMMKADLLILGWSSFSLFPATFNSKQVIYTPVRIGEKADISKLFNSAPTHRWTVLNDTYVDLALQDRQRFCKEGH